MCNSKCCLIHVLELSRKINKILGFENATENFICLSESEAFLRRKPANLSRGFPNMLMIYLDILELIIIVDVHSRSMGTRLTLLNEPTFHCQTTHARRFRIALEKGGCFEFCKIQITVQHVYRTCIIGRNLCRYISKQLVGGNKILKYRARKKQINKVFLKI